MSLRTMRQRVGKTSFHFEKLENRTLMAATGPVISEFLASNVTGLSDADGTKQDWIEIYNPTGSPVVLDGWGLTDDATKPQKWAFPNNDPSVNEVVLAPGARMVVFASNKDRKVPGQEFHTNFALGKGGEYLGLIPPGGSAVSEYAPAFPAQADDISYGVLDSDSTQQRFFNPPTPGAPNTTVGTGVVADTKFSVDRGFYNSSFQLAITTTTSGASIRYTTDGSPPSPTSGTVYNGPITISTTSVVRAIAYKTGFDPSDIDTQTYIFLNDVLNQGKTQPNFPQPTINGLKMDYEMDPQIVNDPAYHDDLIKGLTDIPTMSLTVSQADMWDTGGGFYRSDDLEKPVSVEVIYPDDDDKNVQADGVIEGHSHAELKRSMRLKFSSDTPDSKLETSLFQDALFNGEGATDDHKRIVLRAGFNRSWLRDDVNAKQTTFTEDQWVRDTQLALGGDGSHGNFVHLYINGVYWGLYNPVERPDEHFTSEYYGGDNEDWYAVSHGGPIDGDPTRYDYMRGPLRAKNMAVLANYRELEKYLDITNFSDYLLNAWYAGITDWPDNNFWAGNRNDVPSPTKYFAWDGEYSWASGYGSAAGARVHPAFTKNKSKNEGATISAMFNSAKDSPEFKIAFADRAYKATANGGALTDAEAIARWDGLNALIEDAVIGESARWGDASNAASNRTRNGTFKPEVARKRAMMVGNGAKLITALRAEGYYPSNNPATYSKRGGDVPAGFNLKLNNPNANGTIYYTTDGSDPRVAGGGIGSSAKAYTAAGITLAQSATIRIRVRSASGEWSAGDTAAFTVAGNSPPIIDTQPANKTAEAGQTATFTVAASGSGTLTYQWQRNEQDIAGATSASYTTPPLTATDNGAKYRVVVKNSFGEKISNAATITVTAPSVAIRPLADTYVRDGASAGTNFGAAADLQLKKSGVGSNREIWLKYDLSSFASISSAKLRLFGRIDSSTETPSVSVFSSSNTEWTEAGLTWNSRPEAGTTAHATLTVATATQKNYDFDLTAFLQGEKNAGRNVVTLVIRTATTTTPHMIFSSDEAAANQPQLLVQGAAAAQQSLVVSPSQVQVGEGSQSSFTVKLSQQPASDVTVSISRQSGDSDLTANKTSLVFTASNWNVAQTVNILAAQDVDSANGSAVFAISAASIATQTVTATEQDDDAPIVRRAIADTHVRDGASASTNFGSDTILQVKKGAAGSNREAFLKFEVPASLAGIAAAKLRVYGRIDSATQAPQVGLYYSAETGWSETGATFNNKPGAPDAQLISTITMTPGGSNAKYYEFDVTSFLQDELAAGHALTTFVLRSLTATDPYLIFFSDESATNRPELVITPGEAAPEDPEFVVSNNSVSVAEGSTGSITLKLDKAPTSDVIVTLKRELGDEDLTGTPLTLTFTATNWNIPQTVTIAAAEDADQANGTALFNFVADGFRTATFSATEIDNDAPTSPSTVYANADTYVRDGASATTNFGGAVELQLKQNGVGSNREIWLQFDLTGVSDIANGKLRLFGRIDSATEKPSVAAFASSDTTWTENALTWNSRPAVGADPIATAQTIATSTKKYYEWDLTTFLQGELAAGRTKVSIVLRSLTTTTPHMIFSSDEAGADRPHLQLS